VKVHLIDGTYELFRHFYAIPSRVNADGMDVAAVRGVVGSMLQLLGDGATHVGVATDHVIESWRNDLWATYKDGSGVDPVLKAQFPLLEEACAALGLTVWPMVEDEADDALGSAAWVAAEDPDVEQVLICTPDKDMGQCVGGKIVQLDRRKQVIYDADGIRAKFGVDPESIPDYLAVVGDSADGFPGLQGWGAKGAAKVLARWKHLDLLPDDVAEWDVQVPSIRSMAARFFEHREQAMLFRVLATLKRDCAVGTPSEWAWRGPTDAFDQVCERLEAPEYPKRAAALLAKRS